MVKASIVITCYNLEKYIFRAINSCLNQDFPENEYEIIVVDDGSRDKSREIIDSYDSALVKKIFLPKNKGVAYASNAGIKASRGKYVVRVDGDDYINRNFLRVMTEILEWNNDIGFVYCDLIVVNEKKQRKFQLNTFNRLLNHGAGVMFRKKHLGSVGLYNERLKNCEDHDLILRYSRKYKGYHLRLPYYRYFKREGSLSTRKEERELIKKQNLRRNRYEHLGKIKRK